MANTEMTHIWPQLDERRKQAVHDLEDAARRLADIRTTLRTLEDAGLSVPAEYVSLRTLLISDSPREELASDSMREERYPPLPLAQTAEEPEQREEEEPQSLWSEPEVVPEPEPGTESTISQITTLPLQTAAAIILAHENRPMTATEVSEYLEEVGRVVNRASIAAALNTLVNRRPEYARVERGMYQYVGAGSIPAAPSRVVAHRAEGTTQRRGSIQSTVDSPVELLAEVLSQNPGQWIASSAIFERMYDRGYHPPTGQAALRQLLIRQHRLGKIDKRPDPKNGNLVQYKLSKEALRELPL